MRNLLVNVQPGHEATAGTYCATFTFNAYRTSDTLGVFAWTRGDRVSLEQAQSMGWVAFTSSASEIYDSSIRVIVVSQVYSTKVRVLDGDNAPTNERIMAAVLALSAFDNDQHGTPYGKLLPAVLAAYQQHPYLLIPGEEEDVEAEADRLCSICDGVVTNGNGRDTWYGPVHLACAEEPHILSV